MNNITRSRPDDDTAEIPVTEDAPQDEKKKKLELSLAQIIGGAMAAMTAAGLGSTLGVGGTIVGAAFASVVAGVAGALYTMSLRRTGDRVKTVFVGRGNAAAPVRVPLAEAPVPVQRARRTRPWRAAVIVTLSVFALAAVAITGVEALTGRAMSGGTGTTVQKVRTGSTVTQPEPSATPSASQSASAEPSTTPSGTATAEPTPSAGAASATEPSASAAPSTASTAPSVSPTPATDTGTAADPTG